MNTSLNDFMEKFRSLSASDQQQLIAMLSASTPTVSNANKLQDIFIDEHFADGFECPHCGEDRHIVRHGKSAKGEQRYMCRKCQRTFVENYNTVFYRSHYGFKTWSLFLDCLVNLRTVRQTAEICEIHVETAFTWRHKVLDAINYFATNNTKLKGVVEVDETFTRASFKGSRNMPRLAKKRGTPMKMKSNNKEKVCIFCAVDRSGNHFSKVVTMGNITNYILHNVLDDKLVQGSTLLSDGFTPYKLYAQDNWQDVKHFVVPRDTHKNGVHHINHVNAYHTGLKDFLRHFKGVATKYLQNYLEWYNAIYNTKSLLARSDKLMSPTVRADFTETWADVSNRHILPIAA